MSKVTGKDLFGEDVIEDELLSDKYLIPPFSVLDTKLGDWLNRRRKWAALGIRSEVSREGVVCLPSDSFSSEKYGKGKKQKKAMQSVSIFDPVLCEIMYRWFCPEGGLILDPFSGGSVRGIVAGYLGFDYHGIDLRKEQIESNIEQANEILSNEDKTIPIYYQGDSNKVLDEISNNGFKERDGKRQADMIFSCPPYADLEVYSKDPDDISNMSYQDFITIYRSIIRKSVALLKPNSFCAWVVGDIRDKDGLYRNFVSHTKFAFAEAGARLYNDAVLLNAIGTAPLRSGKAMDASRKMTKMHQNVLVFFKGDPKFIKERFEKQKSTKK